MTRPVVIDVQRLYALAIDAVEAEQCGDELTVRRLLRRIERGELPRAVHEPDLGRPPSALAARDETLEIIEQ